MNKKTIIVGLIICILIVIGVVVIITKPQTTQSNPVNPVTSSVPGATTTEKQFTLTEVAQHNTKDSCYTIVRGNVYDLTPAISTHPGGLDKIMSICGIDGTNAFVNKHGGQPRQEAGLAKLQIGVLVQ